MGRRKNLFTWSQRHEMAIYSENAGPTLMGLMSKAAALDAKRLNLDEEIDLARALTMRLCAMLGAAVEAQKDRAPGELDELVCVVQETVRTALKTVQDLVVSAAKVRILDHGAIQLTSVSWVVGEVTRAIDEVVRARCGDEVADGLVARIGKIKLPEDGTLSKFVMKAADEAFM